MAARTAAVAITAAAMRARLSRLTLKVCDALTGAGTLRNVDHGPSRHRRNAAISSLSRGGQQSKSVDRDTERILGRKFPYSERTIRLSHRRASSLFIARPRFCHCLVCQKPEVLFLSLWPSVDVRNNNAHALQVVGNLWSTKRLGVLT